MKFLQQSSPNNWSCLPTAFAIVLGCPVEYVLELIGHDGSEKLWPALPEPFCRRSFHIQELIMVAWKMNYCVTPFSTECELQPRAMVNPKLFTVNLKSLLVNNVGVITGLYKGSPHAVAWKYPTIYNTNNQIETDTSVIKIEDFWVISKRN